MKNKITEELKPNNLSKDTKVSMRTRIISAIIGLVIVVPPFILGDWFFFALILFASFIAFFEAVRCGGKKAGLSTEHLCAFSCYKEDQNRFLCGK